MSRAIPELLVEASQVVGTPRRSRGALVGTPHNRDSTPHNKQLPKDSQVSYIIYSVQICLCCEHKVVAGHDLVRVAAVQLGNAPAADVARPLTWSLIGPEMWLAGCNSDPGSIRSHLCMSAASADQWQLTIHLKKIFCPQVGLGVMAWGALEGV